MASFDLLGPPSFPEGTEVKAYPLDNWNGAQYTGAAPVGSEDDTKTVTSGVAAFDSLDPDTRYVAYAEVSSQHRYMRFSTLTDPSTGGGGGLPEGGDVGQTILNTAPGEGEWGDTASLSNATPLVAGTATAGTGADASREDHVHPLARLGASLGCPIGMYVRTLGTVGQTIQGAEGTLIATPLLLPQAMTVDRIGVSVNTAGTTGALIRIGLYAHDASFGGPGSLILDAGTVSGTATSTNAEITINQALTSSCWIVMVVQGGAATRPIVRANTGIGFSPVTSDLQNGQVGALTMSGTVAGALPASWTQASTGAQGNIPMMAVRRSA